MEGDYKTPLKLVDAGKPGVRISLIAEPLRLEHPRLSGVFLLVRAEDELRYKQVVTPALVAWRKHFGDFENTKPPIAESEEVLRQLAVGWEGIFDENDAPIPFKTREDGLASDESIAILMRPIFGYMKPFTYLDPETHESKDLTVRRMFVHLVLDEVAKSLSDQAEGKVSPQP